MSRFKEDYQRALELTQSRTQHGQFMPSQHAAQPTPSNTGLDVRARATVSLQKRQQEAHIQQQLRNIERDTRLRLMTSIVASQGAIAMNSPVKSTGPIITSPSSLRLVASASVTGDRTTPFEVGWEWLTGTGPREHAFTNGDPFTELLRSHNHIQETRLLIINQLKKNGGKTGVQSTNPYSLNGVQGVPKYLADYTTLATFGTTGNLAVTYLGSYTLTYSTRAIDIKNRTVTVQFTVHNSSTIASATHPPVIGYTQWWNRHISPRLNEQFLKGPLSRTTQTFIWTETLRW